MRLIKTDFFTDNGNLTIWLTSFQILKICFFASLVILTRNHIWEAISKIFWWKRKWNDRFHEQGRDWKY